MSGRIAFGLIAVTAIAISLLAAGSAAAAAPPYSSAEMGRLSLSPNGKWLLFSDRPASGGGWSTSAPLGIVDVDCLKHGRTLEACEQVLEGLFQRPRLVWSSDSRALLVIQSSTQKSPTLRLERRGAGWRKTPLVLPLGKSKPDLPPVVDRKILLAWPAEAGLETRAAAWADLDADTVDRLNPDSPMESSEPIIDAQGRSAGWVSLDTDGNRVGLGRRRIGWTLPKAVTDRIALLPMPNWFDWNLVPRAQGQGLYFVSGDLGPLSGTLELFDGGTVRALPLPANPGSPLRIVFTPSGSMAVGAFSFDSFYGVEGPWTFTEGLAAYVTAVRKARLGLELIQLQLTDRLDVAVLRFRDVDGPDQLHVYDAPRRVGFRVGRLAGAEPSATLPFAVRSTAVSIPSPSTSLPARLYVADRPRAVRGLVVTFHGGPSVNMFSRNHDLTRWFLEQGFDVLDLDYRGSTGHGADHLLALKAPTDVVVNEDLAATIAWARARPEYAGELVGIQGSSFGGYFGAVAVQADVAGLDFAIMDSPFIDDLARRSWPCGEGSRVATTVFTEVIQADGTCTAGSTGMTDRPRYWPIPVFISAGGKDRQTPLGTTERWFAAVNAKGGCATMTVAKGGRHTLAGLGPLARATIEAAIVQWINDVEAGRASAHCGRRVELTDDFVPPSR